MEAENLFRNNWLKEAVYYLIITVFISSQRSQLAEEAKEHDLFTARSAKCNISPSA